MQELQQQPHVYIPCVADLDSGWLRGDTLWSRYVLEDIESVGDRVVDRLMMMMMIDR